jgi:phosphatidylglycerol:prolipoprotein diacylglycerol transferase
MLIHPDFDPVAIALGPLKIHWYGLAYLAGFIGGVTLGVRASRRPHSNWRPEEVWDLLFYVALGVIVGGRLGYVLFYGWGELSRDPLYLLKVWQGGMSFHGGLIGVIAGFWLFARKTRRTLLDVGDFVAPLTPVGLFFGRMANFINQELWGRAADPSLPWAVQFPLDPSGLARHPSQLYEALLEGVVLFAVLWWYARRRRPAGHVAGLFLVGYALSRIVVEFFREPDNHIGYLAFDALTMGQILSFPMLLLGVFLLIRRSRAPQTS